MSLRDLKSGALIVLSAIETRCGRERGSDVLINDLHSSRHHANITRVAGTTPTTTTTTTSTMAGADHFQLTQTGVNAVKVERPSSSTSISLHKGQTFPLQHLDIIEFPKGHRYLVVLTNDDDPAHPPEGSEVAVVVNQVVVAAADVDNVAVVIDNGGRASGRQEDHHDHDDDVPVSLPPLSKERPRKRFLQEEEEEQEQKEVEDAVKISGVRDGAVNLPENHDSDEYSTGDEEAGGSPNSWILSSESEDIDLGTPPPPPLPPHQDDKQRQSQQRSTVTATRKRVKKEEDRKLQPLRLEEVEDIGEVDTEAAAAAQIKTPFEIYVEAEREKTHQLFADFTDNEVGMVLESRWENLEPEEKRVRQNIFLSFFLSFF